MKRSHLPLLALFATMIACGSGASTPSPASTPSASASAAPQAVPQSGRELPPSPGEFAPFALPRVTRDTLADGARFALITRPTAPLVEARLVIRGAAGALDLGAAHLLSAYLNESGTGDRDGARFATQLESLGARLSVDLHRDAVQVSLTAPKSTFRESFLLAGQLLSQPRWDEAVWKRVKSRASDGARARSRADGQWSVGAAALKELGYVGRPPSFAEVSTPTLATVRDLHKKAFVKPNLSVLMVGDLELDSARAIGEAGLGTLGTKPSPARAPTEVRVPTEERILLIDRPKSSQSSVLIALVAPALSSNRGLSATLLSSCLGDSNAMSNRLFSDVREKRGLAYVLGSDIPLIGNRERPWLIYAATQTAKTSETVQALLQNTRGLWSLSDAEVATAKTLLTASLAGKMEVARDLADLLLEQEINSLATDYWDSLPARVSRENLASVTETFRSIDTRHPLIVINGDAEFLAGPLRALGNVSVLDPLDFHLVRTLAKGN